MVVMVIGRVYVVAPAIHTLSLEDNFVRVVVEEVRHVNAEVPVSTS